MEDVFFKPVITDLGEQFGALDNQPEKWAHQQEPLIGTFPQIRKALKAHFPAGSTPLHIFEQGSTMYTRLLDSLAESGQLRETTELATALLNLRFYILLNAFLAACQESLEKSALNDSLDPAELVKNSYYAPYFFQRSTLSTAEAIAMLQEDLSRLQSLPRETQGILLAVRIQKGVVNTLAETYCPRHPLHYPLVQKLEAVRVSSNPSVIDEIATKLEAILAVLQKDMG